VLVLLFIHVANFAFYLLVAKVQCRGEQGVVRSRDFVFPGEHSGCQWQLCIFYILFDTFCKLFYILFDIFCILISITYYAFFAYQIAYWLHIILHLFFIFSILSIMHILHILCIFCILFAYFFACYLWHAYCSYFAYCFAYLMHIILHIILHILHFIINAYCAYCACCTMHIVYIVHILDEKSHSQGFHCLLPLLLGPPTQGLAVHIPPPTTITTVC
jgi:hypothetical protein